MYLFLYENDCFRQTSDEPTAHDEYCAEEGTLAIFRYTSLFGYERLRINGTQSYWESVPEAKIIDNFPEIGPYHA
jgi:hypothetical protein